jgi:hypothetical protein
MVSTDGEVGLKLRDFLRMWRADGTKLIKESRRVVNGAVWLLYSVYFPDSTITYGRHMAMILKVDAKTRVILMHDLKNLTSEVKENYRQGIDAWFEEHVGKY